MAGERDTPLGADDKRFRALNWIGIVDQLAMTQANRRLDGTDLPMPQFVMLNHFSHRPHESKTVGGVAAAFQQPQPGVTKTVQKLADKGFLAITPDAKDGRVRHLRITEAGLAAHAAARTRLVAAFDGLFAEWTEADLDTLIALLDRLRLYLDSHRDPD
ncbi:MAG: MarR family transcriptional regulator [Geminicoccaceae bacterium]